MNINELVNKQAEMQTRTREMINEFNKPYQSAVAINCCHIGDDNDYSCFLSRVCFELFVADKNKTAYDLFLTDPLLFPAPSFSEFIAIMGETAKFRAEQAERHSDESKFHKD